MRVDVAVIGAGPAGAATSRLLSLRGAKVALFDRSQFPRDKPCGEFVNGQACRYLEKLGVSIKDAQPVDSAVIFAGKERAEVPLRERGRSIRRSDLDDRLLRASEEVGVAFYPGHKVRSVEGDTVYGDGFRCQAGTVIAADGTHSVLARQSGLVRPVRRLQRVGVVAHLRLEETFEPGKVLMFASDGDEDIVGGFCMQSSSVAILSCVLPPGNAKGKGGREFVQERLRKWLGFRAEILDVRTTTCFGHRLSHSFVDRTLFVGDAARFVDPFTGEGIHHALESAFLAADVVGSGKPLSVYARRRSRLEQRYAVCDLVQAIVHQPRMVSRIVRNLRDHKASASSLIGVLTDTLPPRSLLNPKLLKEILL